MIATQKLFETDSYLTQFTAVVLSCEESKGGFAVVLDQTAFYPEGGGQPCDTGVLGGAAVTAVSVQEGVITHKTDAPLEVGSTVTGCIDWARRRDHMEQHTGEHILSGTLHRLFGANNVGFHIGSPTVRMDIDLPLTAAQLAQAEAEANAAVRANTPVRCWIPPEEELKATSYRSKKELNEPVRLVSAGGDLCACCGTHLETTGQVGLIKILSAQNYKGGVRLAVACGQRATEAIAAAYADAEAAGKLVSAAPGKIAAAMERTLAAQATDKQKLAALQNSFAAALAAAAPVGQPCVRFVEGAEGDGLRRIAMAITAKTGARCLLLAPGGQGTSYALAGAAGEDIRPLAKRLNEQYQGRGGGKNGFCQGSFAAEAAGTPALLQELCRLVEAPL